MSASTRTDRIAPEILTRTDDADLAFLARLMDDRFGIPGTNIRFGLDALLGLVPGIGDAVGGIVSSYIIWRARRMGVSNFVLARMAGNMILDSALGLIPVFGDVFDVGFRSNRRNLALLRQYQARQVEPPRPNSFARSA
ncbi:MULTISPECIES: DUF4112 domain-containing protein [Rhodomicrobium]|uniref:DUF4112 domain-containing protein n=1 Tax=Rhodomicrobium TaxID=1068 RepID=UPI000B4A6AD2|nr:MULTISPECIES: DUF4112 domain-containing protein [Rhodomicrobium]